MLTLKEYQKRTLEAARAYFSECVRTGDADLAFYATTRALFGAGIQYRPVADLPGLPYVCLRLPTGGGKTLLACHVVGAAARELLQADQAMVLWLVPSNAIREQTLRALRDRRHPYRQALDACLGSVTVLDVAEALYVRRPELDAGTIIIVSTMQAFRVDDTEGRKVYESSGSLMDHFSAGKGDLFGELDRDANGVLAYSLANVLRLRRPVVIVDEAHNARTPLSFETLARFNPSCIVEFTATPDTEQHPSNVLCSVSAAELHAESMIKLPIVLETRTDWKSLMASAVALRQRLEVAAGEERNATGERIRPVMLIQAQPDRKGQQCLTVEVVERCLKEECRIPESQIRRATGTDRGLEGIDLLDPDCEVRFVITVQALREGWDCPFAYVLCSVAELSSPTAVEQILGRVMRLPGATRKVRSELNSAYAFVTSRSFAESARTLADALVQCHGFNRQEAGDFVKAGGPSVVQQPLLLPDAGVPARPASVTLPEAPAAELPAPLLGKASFDHETRTLTFQGVMEGADRDLLKAWASTAAGTTAVDLLYEMSRLPFGSGGASPSERGEKLSVPALSIRQGDFLEVLEAGHFLDEPWPLSRYDPTLSEADYPSEVAEGERGEINVSGEGRIQYQFLARLHQQIGYLDPQRGWTLPELVYWLDLRIPHPDVTAQESGLFLTRVLQRLTEDRGLDLRQLAHDRYRLRDAIAARIEGYRRQLRNEHYQALLLPDCPTPVVVTPELCFTFPPSEYPCGTRYDGANSFQKHYYPHVGDLKAQGEEFDCACYLDSHPRVRSWVRNLERRPSHSFWLQTSTDRFYPDFVCLLDDGRYLVVEYKGENLWSNDDSKEKRDIGGLWEARSEGRCLFIMPCGRDFPAIDAKIREGSGRAWL